LDLDAWINDPPSESEEEDEEEEKPTDVFVKTTNDYGGPVDKKPTYQPTEEELTQQRESRKFEQQMNPHYLKDVKSPLRTPTFNGDGDIPPIAQLDLNVPLNIPQFASSDKYLNDHKRHKEKESKKVRKKKKKKKGKKSSEEEEEETVGQVHVVNTMTEMPEGATLSDTEESTLAINDPHRALADIDLDIPLHPSEFIPTPTHRGTVKPDNTYYLKMEKKREQEESMDQMPLEKAKEERKKKKKKKDKDKEKDSEKHKSHSHKKHKKHKKEKSQKEVETENVLEL